MINTIFITAVLQYQPDLASSISSKFKVKPNSNNTKSFRKISKDEIEQMSQEEQELSYLNGLVSLNKNFFNPNLARIPKYLISRFFNLTDIKNKDDLKYKNNFEDLLNTILFKQEIDKFSSCKKADISTLKVMSFYLNCIHDVNKAYFCSTLKLCSPWPNKKALNSLGNYKGKKEKGKVYSSLGVVYRNDQQVRLVVQESEEWFGYCPYIFRAHATVLFPPIAQDEIWTIGFIQGITKSEVETIYTEGIRFVLE